jgi:hypothetical protein
VIASCFRSLVYISTSLFFNIISSNIAVHVSVRHRGEQTRSCHISSEGVQFGEDWGNLEMDWRPEHLQIGPIGRGAVQSVQRVQLPQFLLLMLPRMPSPDVTRLYLVEDF